MLGGVSDTRRALRCIMRRQDQVSTHWLGLTTLFSVGLSNVSGLAEEVWFMPDRFILRVRLVWTLVIYLVYKFPRSGTWEGEILGLRS